MEMKIYWKNSNHLGIYVCKSTENDISIMIDFVVDFLTLNFDQESNTLFWCLRNFFQSNFIQMQFCQTHISERIISSKKLGVRWVNNFKEVIVNNIFIFLEKMRSGLYFQQSLVLQILGKTHSRQTRCVIILTSCLRAAKSLWLNFAIFPLLYALARSTALWWTDILVLYI